MFHFSKRKFIFATVAAAVCSTSIAQSLNSTEGPITLVIPFSAGGSTDVVGRLLAEKLSTSINRTVIVENKPGAGGNIAAAQVAKSKADGKTLLLATTGIMSINEYLYKNTGYHIHNNFEPIIYATSISNVLVINKNFPANNLQEFLEVVKKNPGKYTFASSGSGSSTHLTGELFKYLTQTEINHIPYRGSSQALVDLVGGQIDMIFDNAPSAIPMITAEKIKALGVTSLKPIEALPNVPAINEALLPSYESLSWTAILAPKGTPSATVKELNHALNQILADSAVQQRLKELGARAVGGSSQDLKQAIDNERQKWGKVIEAAKIEKI